LAFFGCDRVSLFSFAPAGLVSAAFAYLGTGLHPIWWALWLAPIPVLAIAPRLHARAVFLLGAITWLIGETNQWDYVAHEIELPLPIVILYFVVPAVVFGFGVLFVRSFIRRESLFPFIGWHTNILLRSRRLTAHGAISLTHK
jgi:apolipoprotein N-acyltransferase